MLNYAENDYATELAILGAGPCGLGAAWRAKQLDVSRRPAFLLVDKSVAAGGSAASVTTPEGFTFDFGGHVLYPHEHYGAFKSLLDELVPDWHESKPIRGIWMDGRLVPYPVQRNIHRLPMKKMLRAFWGLLGVRFRETFDTSSVKAENLEAHLNRTFGRGLTNVALGPINRKMWAHDLCELGTEWTSQRSGSGIPNVSKARVRESIMSFITRRDNVGWSDSTLVRYPARGGTGSIWSALAEDVSSNHFGGETVTHIDDRAKIVYFASGRRLSFTHLISTLPLNHLIELLFDNDDLTSLAKSLKYAQAGFVGLGFRGPQPAALAGVHSFHIPDRDIDCWRITIPSNVAPGNAPPGEHWSMLCEISAPLDRCLDMPLMSDRIVRRLRTLGLVPEGVEIVSRWSEKLHFGYPIPFVGRDAILRQINSALWSRGILSRGRFGGWKYEVSNQDHTFMQGVEAVDFLYEDRPETTYRFPELVN